MRIKNSIKNMYISIVTQVVIILLGFLSRKVFIDTLGTEYLGVNGLLTNVLSMLSLVEGGIGISIVYNLYKPLAENDEKKIVTLVQLYKKIYIFLAIIVFILSLFLYPFLGVFMNDNPGIPFIGVVYFIFVLKNVVSYMNAHKWSLINADQKGYVLARYDLVFNIITTISKILILQITRNYLLFIIIELVLFLFKNIWNGKIVKDRYPYIKTRKKYEVDKETKNNVIKNAKALFLHNIGSYCVFGTDNLLIGGFISLTAVGLYSNYNMLIGQVHSLIRPFLNSIDASVGNLIASEDKEKSYDIFNVLYFVNFWLYSVAVIALFNLVEPFINLWLGEGFLLDRFTFIVLLINFYITGLRSSILTFKNKAGIFAQDKYVTIIVAAINLISSVILVNIMGLAGIFIGTTISTISIPIWNQPKLVYNIVFKKSVFEYLKKYIYYLILTIFAGTVTSYICDLLINTNNFWNIILRGIICIIIPSSIYLLLFFNKSEFRYLYNILKDYIVSSKKYKFLIKN